MLFETLESRKLFSVCALHPVPAPATPPVVSPIVADQKLIDAALSQLRKDHSSFDKTLASDLKSMLSDGLRKDATLLPLIQQVETDMTNMRQDLSADWQAEKPVLLSDQKALCSEEMQICKDKRNPTSLKADQAAQLADQIQLQNDLITGLDARLATVQTDENTIADDLGAVFGALFTDTSASPALTAAVNKFRTDTLNSLNAVGSDLLSVITARAQLVNDLMAMQT